MYASERHTAIEQQLERDGRVAVVDLARDFDVTTETIRRDLALLEENSRLRRVHGGAVPTARASTLETSIDERRLVRHHEKSAIASRALDAVSPNFRGSIFLDAGSTSAALAVQLPAHLRTSQAHAELVTHSIPVAYELGQRPDPHVTIIGGRVRGVTAAAVGSATVEAISGLRPDLAFIGANGLSADFGLSTPDPDEASVKRAIVKAARLVVLLADSSKLDQDSLVRFAHLSEIDVLVTDEAPGVALAAALADAGVDVWLA